MLWSAPVLERVIDCWPRAGGPDREPPPSKSLVSADYPKIFRRALNVPCRQPIPQNAAAACTAARSGSSIQRVRAVRPEQWALATPTATGTFTGWSATSSSGRPGAPVMLGSTAATVERPAERRATPDGAAGRLVGGQAAAVDALGAVPPEHRGTGAAATATAGELGWRLATELTVHSWDLARAIDAADEFPNDLLAHVLEQAKRHAADWFPAERYATPIPVPGCTDDLTELLALTGRNRWWRRS